MKPVIVLGEAWSETLKIYIEGHLLWNKGQEQRGDSRWLEGKKLYKEAVFDVFGEKAIIRNRGRIDCDERSEIPFSELGINQQQQGEVKMSEVERQDVVESNLNTLITAARAEGTIDARVALELLSEKLRDDGTGYYHWAPLGSDALATWQIRIPREDKADEDWLKEESADVVHICHPVPFLEAIEIRDKEASALHVGYVRDANVNLENLDEFKCSKCKREMPEDERKKAKIQIAMHLLKRKVK